MSRRRRAEARRAVRPEQNLAVRLSRSCARDGTPAATLGAPVAAFLSWIGRPVARALLFVIQLIAALIAIVLQVGQLAVRWVGAMSLSAALIIVEATRRTSTPARPSPSWASARRSDSGSRSSSTITASWSTLPATPASSARKSGSDHRQETAGSAPSVDPAARRGAGGDPDRGRLPGKAAARQRSRRLRPRRARRRARGRPSAGPRGRQGGARVHRHGGHAPARDSGLRSPPRRSSSSAAACSPTTLAV